MQITVKLFALMREKAGTDTIPLEVPAGAAITQALAALVGQYPTLEPYMANTRFSLRMDFADPNTILAEGDELVLIPPVSGGT
jgi:molybdopterin synthase sulfur carrier subunit